MHRDIKAVYCEKSKRWYKYEPYVEQTEDLSSVFLHVREDNNYYNFTKLAHRIYWYAKPLSQLEILTLKNKCPETLL